MTRFSLVVPTLRRRDTLEHTLATLLVQEDAEIVVQNNGNDPPTRTLVESLDDPRIRHFHTDDVLPMTENWERALANATGDVIVFVGDDDGLLPDACAIAASVFQSDDVEILSWQPFLYLWPGFWEERRRNRLQATVEFAFVLEQVATRPLLRRFYAFEVHYSKLPMIYNSFIRRSVVDRVIARHGKYFFGSTPDVTSGIVNAAFCSSFLRSSRPLSVAGLSHHSIGNKLTRAESRATREHVERDFPLLAANTETAAISNLEYLIGREMRVIEEEVLGEGAVTFSRRGLVRAIAAAINESPSQYDASRALVEALIERFGLDPGDVPVPPRMQHSPAPPDGVHVLGPYEVLFVFDGNRIGLRSIADAVSLMAQLVPSPATMVMPEPRDSDGTPVVSTEALSFAKGAGGTNALVSGWAEPESWGTWSVDREAVLNLALPASADRPVRLALHFRTVPLPSDQPRVVECAIGERTLQRWEFSHSDYEGVRLIDIPRDASSAGVLDLKFLNLDARSPKELGLSEDVRPLGIGVERIRLLGDDADT
jgi:glycosyltransferase involved in cell wall biosynthesis